MRRGILTLLACLGLVTPATAGVRVYSLAGDSSNFFPTDGTLFWPQASQGQARILDAGDDAPVLIDLSLEIDFSWVVGPALPSIPGSTAVLEIHREIAPSPGQSGTGSLTTAIDWGVLTGWTQTGYTGCNTFCPGGCGGASACIPFVGFEGTGAPPPLASEDFDTGSWDFAPDASAFSAPSLEIVNLSGGAVTEHVVWNGTLLPLEIPVLPALALAGIGALLTALGARALRRPGSRD